MPADALVAPGPRVTKQTPGRPVTLPIGLRHHRRAALVTADRHGDAAVAERIQHGEKALAGNAEHMLDAVDHELFDQRRGGGSARCVLVHLKSLEVVVAASLTR